MPRSGFLAPQAFEFSRALLHGQKLARGPVAVHAGLPITFDLRCVRFFIAALRALSPTGLFTRARCAIPSSRVSGKTYELGQGPAMGNRYCRRLPRPARRRLPSDPNFCAWLNRLPAIPISHQQDRHFVSEASFPLGPLGMLVRLIHQALNGM